MADESDDQDEFVLEETHHPEVGEEFSGQHGERFAVFVQWEPGETFQYEESVVSSDSKLALLQAREVIDRRWDPESVWIVPHTEIMSPDLEEISLSPSTDRSYRTTAYYAQNMEMPEITDDDDEVFG